MAYLFYTWQDSTVNCKISLNTKFQAASSVLHIRPSISSILNLFGIAGLLEFVFFCRLIENFWLLYYFYLCPYSYVLTPMSLPLLFFFGAIIILKNSVAEFTTMSVNLFTCISITSSDIVSGKEVI